MEKETLKQDFFDEEKAKYDRAFPSLSKVFPKNVYIALGPMMVKLQWLMEGQCRICSGWNCDRYVIGHYKILGQNVNGICTTCFLSLLKFKKLARVVKPSEMK
jgi:hypothetical protein